LALHRSGYNWRFVQAQKPTQTSALPLDPALLDSIARDLGTPAYVYDEARIRRAFTALDAALAPYPHALHYALKANSTLAIARLLRQLGSHADANSVGEIEVALRAGFIPEQIVFTGVGKTPEELERAVSLGVKAINAESAGELGRISAIARRLGTRARVAVRVNPDIDARSHPHISTGLRTNKFGVPLEEARALYRDISSDTALQASGIHLHLGSQITTLEPLAQAAARVVALVGELREDGVVLDHVDLGGGLGISYDGAPVPGVEDYARTMAAAIGPLGLELLLEPGRALVGAAGLLLSRVVDVKTYPGGLRFAILDAGMTELMRPALYGAYHRIVPVAPRDGTPQPYEVVGPICESSDIFGRERMLPPLEPGDLVAILDTGAYGSVMGSTYNRRPLPPEVLVSDGRARVIRRRQRLDDLLALEV
jgi:diaminopimelate decarboxylase